MHEFILYAQVPNERIGTALQVLAGYTRSQPVDLCEQTLIYAQVKVPEAAISRKGQPKQQLHNNPRPLFEKITRSLALSKDGKPPVPRNRDWYIRAEQTPDPAVEPIKPGSGKPTHISRDVVERLATEPDLDRFQVTDLYKFRHQYTIAGHQFVSGNIIVRVYRFHEEIHPNHPINRELFLPKESNLIDESGTWIVEALIRTEDTSNTKIVEAAKKELAFFRSAMEGALDFYAPDRLALDTRVKGL